MICEEVRLASALGGRILSDMRTDLGVLHKGHVITEEDVVMLQVMGIERITIAKIEDGDVELKTAQEIISNRLCGLNTAYVLCEDGIVKIVATSDGYFTSDENRINNLNKKMSTISLNSIPLYSFVKSGDVIAKLEFTLPLYSLQYVEDIVFSLSGNLDLLTVSMPNKKKVGIIYAEFYKDGLEKKHFSNSLLKLVGNLQGLDLEFSKEYFADYSANSVADSIQDALDDEQDLVFILSNVRTSYRKDVIPSALDSIIDEMVNEDISNIDVSDFMVAIKRNMRIINIPVNYSNIDSNLIDELILKTIINDKISNSDFAITDIKLPVIGEKLSLEEQKRLTVATKKDKKANVAVIILAAGSSSRAGYNKLLADVNGKPLFVKTVEAAIQSEVGPVFVVTGYQGRELEKALKGMDVNIINNLSYSDGIKSSIKLGINHVPSFCDGVILLPADMPNISSRHLMNMVKKIDRRKNNQVIITLCDDIKRNPILWSNALYKYAETVPESSYMRPVLVEFEDYTDYVIIENEDELLDVDFPADVEKARK